MLQEPAIETRRRAFTGIRPRSSSAALCLCMGISPPPPVYTTDLLMLKEFDVCIYNGILETKDLFVDIYRDIYQRIDG
jgi:hypothetical protein